jgi:uncharacterized protein
MGSAAERGFEEICRPILGHPEYNRLRVYAHHGRSVHSHCLSVARLSFRIGRLLGLRTEELVRGALLHDFFLYDWRTERRPGGKMHGFSHARIALDNAERVFGPLRPLERDIILHHMWPLNPALPASAEAILVCALDKAVAAWETARAIMGCSRTS